MSRAVWSGQYESRVLILRHKKTRVCSNHMPHHNIQRLQTCESHLPPTKQVCGDVWWLFLLWHHRFIYFTMRHTNDKWIEIKTSLKGILRVPLRKNTSKASQNIFLCLYQDFEVCGDLKHLYNTFHKWNIVFNIQICIE